MTAVVNTSTCLRLHVADGARARVLVDASPQVSLMQWLIAAGRPQQASRFRSQVRRAVGSAGRSGVVTLAAPSNRYLPEFSTPMAPGSWASVTNQVEELRSLPSNVVVDELDEHWGAALPPNWRAVAADPQSWLRSFATACADVWDECASLWDYARVALERETRRVGAAVVSGTFEHLLSTLHPDIHYRDNVLSFDCGDDQRFELGDRPLVLVPMIAERPRAVVSFGRADVAYIAYTIPWRGRVETAHHEDAMDLVLTPIRAAALRALRRPMTMGELARILHCAPSTATYHCDQLVAARLVTRERRGAVTMIARTERAAELEDLLSFRE